MPKLSAINNGSKVLLPVKGGGTVDAYKLAYNFYKKSEADLILGWVTGTYIELPSASYDFEGNSGFMTYAGSLYDVLSDHYKNMLADSIRGSLIEVPINAGAYGATDTIYRSVFAPSASEVVGYSSQQIGAIKTVLANSEAAWISTRSIAAKSTTSGSYAGYVRAYHQEGNSSTAGGTSSHPTSEDIRACFIITIDGNVECATSSGGQSPRQLLSNPGGKSTESGTEPSERVPERGCS